MTQEISSPFLKGPRLLPPPRLFPRLPFSIFSMPLLAPTDYLARLKAAGMGIVDLRGIFHHWERHIPSSSCNRFTSNKRCSKKSPQHSHGSSRSLLYLPAPVATFSRARASLPSWP